MSPFVVLSIFQTFQLSLGFKILSPHPLPPRFLDCLLSCVQWPCYFVCVSILHYGLEMVCPPRVYVLEAQCECNGTEVGLVRGEQVTRDTILRSNQRMPSGSGLGPMGVG